MNKLISLGARLFLVPILIIAACAPAAFAQNAGSVGSDFYSQMPTLYTKGVTYSTPNITFNATPPTNATITVVVWRWAFISGQTTPAGLVVQLCNTDPAVGTCLDISSSPSGTTTFWSGDGLTSGPKFVVKMKVPGTGAIIPNRDPSNTDQVDVNYQYY